MCSCDRRSLLGVGLALPLLVGTRAVLADDACVVFDTALQGAVTPDQALQRLRACSKANVLIGLAS